MNRSYSKIRHIQEANLRLERRLLKEEEEVTPTTSSEPVDTTSSVSDCVSLMKKNEDNNLGGSWLEPLTINGTVKIEYNATVSPNYRSVTVYKDGVSYCKIPTKKGTGDCSGKMKGENPNSVGGSIAATLSSPVTISDSGPVSPAYQGTVIKDSNGYFCRVPN